MTTAELRALLEKAKHGPVARRMVASAQLADALPALLAVVEAAEEVEASEVGVLDALNAGGIGYGNAIERLKAARVVVRAAVRAWRAGA